MSNLLFPVVWMIVGLLLSYAIWYMWLTEVNRWRGSRPACPSPGAILVMFIGGVCLPLTAVVAFSFWLATSNGPARFFDWMCRPLCNKRIDL